MDVGKLLLELPDWKMLGNSLVREYNFPTFLEAVDFVNLIASLAEKADHHPDILISYTRVTLSLTTHSTGKLTEKDFALAKEINDCR